MANFATVVTVFSDSENRRTYAIAGNTVRKPRLLIQKRKVPANSTASSESSLQVVYGTEDAGSNVLPSKIVFDTGVRYPANCLATDVTAALVVFRDFVASDQFTNLVNSQAYVA